MNPLNNFFNSSGQVQWPAQNAFDHEDQQPDAGSGDSRPDPQLAVNSFALSAPAYQSNRVAIAGPSSANEPKALQTRHREVRWDLYQTELKELYLIQNKTLEEIRKYMSQERSFNATHVF